MNLQVSTLLLIGLSLCSAHFGSGSLTMQDINPHVYCGRNLALALAEICSLQDKADKRSGGTMYGVILPPYYKDGSILHGNSGGFGWPWLSPHKARGLTPTRGKRVVGGVLDECCSKACSIDEMLNYCN